MGEEVGDGVLVFKLKHLKPLFLEPIMFCEKNYILA